MVFIIYSLSFLSSWFNNGNKIVAASVDTRFVLGLFLGIRLEQGAKKRKILDLLVTLHLFGLMTSFPLSSKQINSNWQLQHMDRIQHQNL